jgi:N-acetyl-anhydromuramyl-L-alanine amidase AmpD
MTFSPNCSGILKDPKFIVVHYTASGNFATTRDRLLNKESKVSAHYLIGRAGEIVQLVPLNKCAWHAGESEWKGYKGLNKYSIGIELVSFGPLVLKDGKFYSAEYGTEVPANEVHDGAPSTSTYRYWQTFTEPQLAQLRATISELKRLYPSITEVIGHRDCAPKRKQDPWPLDLSAFQ